VRCSGVQTSSDPAKADTGTRAAAELVTTIRFTVPAFWADLKTPMVAWMAGLMNSAVRSVVDVLDGVVESALDEEVRNDDEGQLVLADVLQGRIRANGLCFLLAADCCADLVAMLESSAKSREAHEASGASEKNEFACHDEGLM
jgi:hypothetical protein